MGKILSDIRQEDSQPKSEYDNISKYGEVLCLLL